MAEPLQLDGCLSLAAGVNVTVQSEVTGLCRGISVPQGAMLFVSPAFSERPVVVGLNIHVEGALQKSGVTISWFTGVIWDSGRMEIAEGSTVFASPVGPVGLLGDWAGQSCCAYYPYDSGHDRRRRQPICPRRHSLQRCRDSRRMYDHIERGQHHSCCRRSRVMPRIGAGSGDQRNSCLE